MHNKYCIIDNEKVIDGSYNWSNNAKYNLEYIIVIESTVVAKMYKENFDKIYNNPKYYNFEEYNELG
ncbi:phospholipase D-like domain-containing protein [uncultured Clostridium sp.]|uniref:phospholipase D-like domain-containing protein n=1 Tax=uncultured Clostridium sp. TaxID=59620 RepID=UPI0028E3C8D0|nr:phospholipase D-like domain-containing protein [uncultured Clostridium sp.]